MTEPEAVAALTGMMETIKRTAGPALGIVRKFWPQAGGLERHLRGLYESAQYVQEEAKKL
jgi:hypothetical protein